MSYTDLDMWLEHLERGWRETQNSTYVWQAMAQSLHTDPAGGSLPAWCLEYLRETAAEIADTTISVARREISADEALAHTNEALGLSRQGYNAYSNRINDERAIGAVLDVECGRKRREDVHATAKGAQRIMRRGKRLYGMVDKTSG
jgi:hypothetical protein